MLAVEGTNMNDQDQAPDTAQMILNCVFEGDGSSVTEEDWEQIDATASYTVASNVDDFRGGRFDEVLTFSDGSKLAISGGAIDTVEGWVEADPGAPTYLLEPEPPISGREWPDDD
jgi:hypothetical protein